MKTLLAAATLGVGLWWTVLASVWLLLIRLDYYARRPEYPDDSEWLVGVASLSIGCSLLAWAAFQFVRVMQSGEE